MSSPKAQPGRREATRLETDEHVRKILVTAAADLSNRVIDVHHAASAVLWLVKDRSSGFVCHQRSRVKELDFLTLIEGVVNARRPGPRPGRSGAESIDDTEHGASIKNAMVRRLDLGLQP